MGGDPIYKTEGSLAAPFGFVDYWGFYKNAEIIPFRSR